MAKKRILCFGDSNTWGYAPEQLPFPRLDENSRWTGLLQKKFGNEWQVLEFGLCGCTSGFANEVRGINTNAHVLYPSVLFANLPVDIVCIMLGTNDLKTEFDWKSGDTAKNLDSLVSLTRGMAPNAKIVLVAPVIFQQGIESNASLGFVESSIEKSVLCAKEVADLAQRREILLFDTNAVVHELCSDGCHFTVESHKAFAEAMADFIAKVRG